MESVPLMWGPVTASPVGIEPMTILEGGGGPPPIIDIQYITARIHENSMNCTGWPPNTPYDCAEARRTQVADATFRDIRIAHDHVMVELNIRNVMAVRWSKTTNFKRRRGGGLLNDESIIKSLHT